MQLEIGKIYKFDYESSSPKKEKKEKQDGVLCSVLPTERSKIIAYYTNPEYISSINNAFDRRKETLSEYLSEVGNLKSISEARKANKIRRKSDTEKDLEEKIKEMKGTLFKKKEDKKEISDEKVVHVLPYLYRYYNPDNMTISEDGNIEAIFVNKIITQTGKQQNLFLKLNGKFMVSKEDYEKMLPAID